MSLETVKFDLLGLKPGDKVLDLGCGEGRHAISACLIEGIFSVGIDLSRRDLKTALGRYKEGGFKVASKSKDRQAGMLLSVATGDLLPFADNTFDKVICSEVLEHIENYESVLQEIERVIKTDGKLAVSVPRFWPEWICWKLSAGYHQVEGGHIRIFRTKQLVNSIERRGFRFIKRHWAHSLHVPYWWLKCLFWDREPWPVRMYHKLLVWDLMSAPRLTKWIDSLLNPLMGKSVVIYFDK